jgi:hypothetical protein
MRFPIGLTLLAAVIVMAIVLVIGTIIINPDRSLLAYAHFSHEVISPNADGVDDIAEFSYEVTRNSAISLVFTNSADGSEYVFRDDEPRSPDEYRVLFSGVVDGYILPDEVVSGDVLRRLMPEGEYAWTFTVVAKDNEETAEISGTLVVEDADSPLPEMTTFEISPNIFTPNQDGIADRTMLNIYLTTEAELTVHLQGEDGEQIYIPRREEGREDGEPGRHSFDYEGGVDIGADPPTDGEYTVIAEARDAEGQITQRMATLTIRDGGKPLAEIVGQPTGVDVVFDVIPYDERYYSEIDNMGDMLSMPNDPQSLSNTPITMPVGDLLVFKLSIYNYGAAPIRTAGPWPGTVYQQRQVAASFGQYEQSGAWRVGIQCETSLQPFPWRWAIGTQDDMYTETDPSNGNVYYYLAPEGRTEVWGAIRMTDLVEARNPQACWAGLIHEDVGITLQNNNVGRREVELADLSYDDDN